VNEVLREIIANELERHDDEGPLELVTITGVEVDPEFQQAKVYFSALATSATPEEVAAALDDRRIRLQAVVAKNVRLKRTPQLTFVADPAIAEGERVEGILRDIKQADAGDDA